MASSRFGFGSMLLIFAIVLVVMPGRVAAFGAGNIPSIAQVEGHNWRHGDIEDMLKTIAFLHGKKWTTLMVQRTYFGNWLRDYSQAVDVGSLKGVNAETIRILVWVLSFLSNGYATGEFQVTAERLGVYRPEEHIDNPLGYAEGADARDFDKRLRGPVRPVETEIDRHTGMKNYISNERGDWATSAGYLRFSIARSIHFGRMYTNGRSSGKEEDLCEALRCLGQSLHCLEDFSAHSNYCELALREMHYSGVFPHCGIGSEIDLHGRRVFPLVTGTFGGVDFLHSVLGEVGDHFTQSEVDQLDVVMETCEKGSSGGGGGGGSSGSRGLGFGFGSSSKSATMDFISLVGQLPGIGGGMASEASNLKRMSERQREENSRGMYSSSRSHGGDGYSNPNHVPGMSDSFDPVKVSGQIYPILEFRDKIVKNINKMISKIPGLEKLLEHISETLTAFVLGLLAPFVRPIINQVTKTLKDGSSGVISASAKSQLEPWEDPHCTDPTHSMLSKDHFTNVLNPCAGRVAAAILQYATPRILYAWEHTGVPVDEVVDDVLRAFHHPAIRRDSVEIQRTMFDTVRKWADEFSHGHDINRVLGSESVKNGKNHILSSNQKTGSRSHGDDGCGGGIFNQLGHGQPKGSLWSQVKTRDLDEMGVGDGHGGLRPNYYASESDSRPNSSYGGSGSLQSPGYGYGGHSAAPPGDYNAPYPPDTYRPGGGEAEGYYGSSGGGSHAPSHHGHPPPHHGHHPPPSHHNPYQQQPPYGHAPPPGAYGGPPPPGAYGGPPPPGYGAPPYPSGGPGGDPYAPSQPQYAPQGGYPGGYGGGYGGNPPYPT